MLGTTISHYRITGKLGIGGMGIVYQARIFAWPGPSPSSSCPRNWPATPRRPGDCEREARTLAGLNHPNICTVYEIDEHEGSAFIVMERLEGRT